MMFYNPHNSPR